MIPPVETVVQVYADKSLEEVTPLALKGDVPAMMTLAYRYEQGIGTPQDINKAAEWYLHAARRRDVEATYRLALIYANPDCPLYNFKSGKAWLRRAKRMGHIQAGVKLYAYPARPVTK
jgi:TPR repeat protein